MILCDYQSLVKYKAQLPCLDQALACVETLRSKGFPDGRHEFAGGFLFVQRGYTKPVAEGRFEAHRKYIDIQYLIEGEEYALSAPVETLTAATEYDEHADIMFYDGAADSPSVMHIMPGMCYIAFPEDGHIPCCTMNEARPYLKIVMKIPVLECTDTSTEESAALLKEICRYDTPTITNVLATYPEKKAYCLSLYDAWEDCWYSNSDLKCMFPELGRRAGYAVTVTFGLPESGKPEVSFLRLYEAIAQSPKPVILCVKQDFPERYKKKNGLAGGNMMTAFRSLGCVGLISDGPSRDLEEVRALGMQYMLTGTTAGHGPFCIHAVNEPVTICDMEVFPGEIIHTDENGAVKFPQEYLREVVVRCEALSRMEQKKQQLFSRTEDPEELYRIKQEKIME